MIEYLLDLKQKGCKMDFDAATDSGGNGGQHRRMQMITQMFANEQNCNWDELDNLARIVDAVCCEKRSRDDVVSCAPNFKTNFATPSSCSPSCAIAMREFTSRCSGVMRGIFGEARYHDIDAFQAQCVLETKDNTAAIVDVLESLNCPDASDLGGGDVGASACISGPCQNLAKCMDDLDQYSCSCMVGFSGSECSVDINECDSFPCSNTGACADSSTDTTVATDAYTCTCVPGYSGDTCMDDVDECASEPCDHLATCDDSITTATTTPIPAGEYICTCRHGYGGSNCDDTNDACDSNPCQHNGLCSSVYTTYHCVCENSWGGWNCEQDPCDGVECGHGHCVTGECVCEYGWDRLPDCSSCLTTVSSAVQTDGYINDWDAELDYTCPPNSVMTGIYSVHDNGREDRRFKISCSAVASTVHNDGFSVWLNDWDNQLDYTCEGSKVMTGLHSKHKDSKEDRRHKFKCGTIDGATTTSIGSLGDYLNDWDQPLDFQCPPNSAFKRIESDHDNGREDRRFKIQCASIDLGWSC
jgi:hypothetical protein